LWTIFSFIVVLAGPRQALPAENFSIVRIDAITALHARPRFDAFHLWINRPKSD
jgi:hypothetical protein